MSKRKRTKGPAKAGLTVMLLLGIGVVVGLAAYVKLTPADKVPAAEHRPTATETLKSPRSSSRRHTEIQAETNAPAGTEVVVYEPEWKGDDLTFHSARVSVPDDTDPKVYAVNQFLEKSKTVDPAAKLEKVDIKDGIANLYFTSAFEQTHGAMDEKMLIEGLQRTMGQFEDVEKFWLYADGKKVETLGEADLSDLIPVIRRGGPPVQVTAKQSGSSRTRATRSAQTR